MIEVFKTNVLNEEDATTLLVGIHMAYPQYKANFDLDDCDRILRVESRNGYVDSFSITQLLSLHGFHGEVLPDDSFDDERAELLQTGLDKLIPT